MMLGRKARDIEAKSRTGYPEEFHARVLPREVRRLGDAFGLRAMGVNLVTIFPGKESSLRHCHTQEDEFVYVLEGELVLHTNEGEESLTPGMCAGFRAGDGNGHHLINRSECPATFLVMSNRHPEDGVSYLDDDLEVKKGADGKYVFSRKGT